MSDKKLLKRLEEAQASVRQGEAAAHRSEWYNKLAQEIAAHRDRLSQKEQKGYKLDLMLRVAGRVDGFAAVCGDCQLHQQEIGRLSRDLWDSSLMSREGQRGHSRKIDDIVKHLKQQHKLVNEGQHSGMWSGIGIAIGIGIGTGVDGGGIGIPIGIAVGFVVGRLLDAKAKRKGRVI